MRARRLPNRVRAAPRVVLQCAIQIKIRWLWLFGYFLPPRCRDILHHTASHHQGGRAMPRTWQARVVIAPDLHHGTPCIKGTRVPLATITGSLADGIAQGISGILSFNPAAHLLSEKRR
ncbi:MAG: DUF433 domain-containing protein [Chloroflexi bacterium]|nr:DUF433 domain-containing protein [Chloroflexota bacterium]